MGIVLGLLVEHLLITGLALALSTAVALPLGVWIARNQRRKDIVLGGLGILFTVPSIALIILLIPLFGLNARSVIVALIIYAQIILVRNITAGLEGVDAAVLEAARGMGMGRWQIWWRIELPLALPVILAGARIAAVAVVAIAAIGAKFNAGGLGELLFQGIAQAGRYDKIWAGAIMVALLALGLNSALLSLERRVSAWERAL
jgi:osmoprotectant transport system permease protein